MLQQKILLHSLLYGEITLLDEISTFQYDQ
jgi:hypothetical protein